MRVLLLNSITGCFYAGDKHWTRDLAEAFGLTDVEQAIRLNIRDGLGATDLVLVYENPPASVAVPITGSARASACGAS